MAMARMLPLWICARHEQLGRQMRAGADAGGAVVELARLRPCQIEKFVDRLHRQVFSDHEHVLEGAGPGERSEVTDRVVARLLEQEHVVAVRLVVAEDDRVAVGLGAGDRARADRSRGAGLVAHDHVLPEGEGQFLSDDTGDGVGRAAGWVGDNDGHWVGGEGLRPGEAGDESQTSQKAKGITTCECQVRFLKGGGGSRRHGG
jgi:hypothetical protein